MLGAIAGDIVGSVYEGRRIKTVGFPLFVPASRYTDDTVLTVAVADVLMHGGDYARAFRDYVRRHPGRGYGGLFARWARDPAAGPYRSFGNGSAMRVSPVGWARQTLEEVLAEARRSAAVTHDHPEGIKGAQAVAAAVFLGRSGAGKAAIREHVESAFGYDLGRTLAELRPVYGFDVTCQGSVPESFVAFLEADGVEAAIRNAVSLGGDTDTMACIAGAIAEACFGGVPAAIRTEVERRLDPDLLAVVRAFEERYAF